jgi:uncharacterized protein (UPF0548 family)
MFTFRRPTDDDVRRLLARQAGQPWSYGRVEVTRGDPQPRPGWKIDRHRVPLGHGMATFAAACEALRAWKMFPPQMTCVYWPDSPQRPGEVVAVLYRARPVCLWMLFPARVVFAIDSVEHQVHRYGFAYGTLPDHPERGEERFLVEWNEADDSVWYDLLAVSQPAHWLARIGYPYARHEQAKFRRLSGAAMQAAVKSPLNR